MTATLLAVLEDEGRLSLYDRLPALLPGVEGESGTGPSLLPRSTWERLHTPFRDNYASGWLRYQSDRLGGPVTLHNGSNTLWYALLVLVPARNSVLAFATNDGAIRRAENAFGELARELTVPTPSGSRSRQK